jgi:hypothetical protein
MVGIEAHLERSVKPPVVAVLERFPDRQRHPCINRRAAIQINEFDGPSNLLSNVCTRRFQMPVAKIHVLEGQYDERRLRSVSKAVQDALISVLKIPTDDFFQIIHVLPRNRFLHTPSFLGLKYSDDLILLELTFISGRPKETRLALLKELNERIVAGAGISPDDLVINLCEIAGENASFGQGLAQRAFISQVT